MQRLIKEGATSPANSDKTATTYKKQTKLVYF